MNRPQEARRGNARLWLVLVPAVVFGALAALFWAGLSGEPSKIPSALIGKPVPEGMYSMSPMPSRASAPIWSRMVRLSILLLT